MRLLLAAALVFMALPAHAGEDDFIVKDSKLSVTDAVAKLEKAIAAAPPTLIAKIDHGANAKKAGLTFTESVLLVFGAPKIGTPIMQANPLVGLDLPVKVLVWDDNGQTKIAYLNPEELNDRHDLDGKADKSIKQMSGALDKITSAAVE